MIKLCSTMQEYVASIQQGIVSCEAYEDYVPEIKRYGAFLEKYLIDAPEDVNAVCQLASVYNELRDERCVSVDLLEAFLSDHIKTLSDSDKSRVFTNLAFYYEDDGDIDKAERCLREAVSCDQELPNAFDALARICCYDKNKFEEAIVYFKKAMSLSEDIKYAYNHAVILYQKGDISKAMAIFENLAAIQPEERRIIYGLGICRYYLGDVKEALCIAEQLTAGVDNCDYISEGELAALFFLCGDFEKHNRMFDESNYYTESSWIYPYFYGLCALDRHDAAREKLSAFLKEKDDNSESVKSDPISEWKTEENRNDYIKELQKERADIEAAYQKVQNGEKPDIAIRLWCMYDCYLIDCVRHQKTSEVENMPQKSS